MDSPTINPFFPNELFSIKINNLNISLVFAFNSEQFAVYAPPWEQWKIKEFFL